jgi:hypothetical protein
MFKEEFWAVGPEGVDWINLARNKEKWRALVNAVVNFRVAWNARNFLTSRETNIFSERTVLHVFGCFQEQCFSALSNPQYRGTFSSHIGLIILWLLPELEPRVFFAWNLVVKDTCPFHLSVRNLRCVVDDSVLYTIAMLFEPAPPLI